MFKKTKLNNINFSRIYDKAEQIIESAPIINKRRKWRLIFKFIKYFSFVILGAVGLLILFIVINLLNFKEVYISSLSGKNNLKQAASAVKNRDFKEAVVFSQAAESNFNTAFNNLENFRGSFFIAHTPVLGNQYNDLMYLLKSAEILSKAGTRGSLIGQEFENIFLRQKNLSYSKLSLEEKQNILKLIYESGPELNGLKANLELAYLNLDQVNLGFFLWPLNNKINNFKNQLSQGIELLSNTIPMTEILPTLAGYPTKTNFLVMLQNNDELRPSGGFLGTYGILEMANGDIINFNTHDIYHMDMPVKDKLNITPPEVLKKYLVDKWYMRDANWSPDWPTSAKQIEWFFKKENKLLPNKDKEYGFRGDFSGVMAITPKFVTDLLGLVGPIYINNEEYNEDNFHNLLQYKVERDYVNLGVPSWQRKEIIGDISRELKIKLLDMPAERWLEIFSIIQENIREKNLLVYLKDKYLQNLGKNLVWDGEVKKTLGDYLMVVDANLGSFKSDAVMNKSINYNLSQNANGWFAKLRINYGHSGNFDWRTTRYQSYTRLYVPLGSELIKAEGFTDGEVEVNTALGKTYFGAYIAIEPGEIGSLYFEYKLPEEISQLAKDGYYSLFTQKQPGNNIEELVVDLNLNNKVKSYSPKGFSVEQIGDNIRWESSLETDKGFEVNF